MTASILTDCPFCHHEEASIVQKGQPTRNGGRWDIYQCDECRCYYPRPRLDQTQSLETITELQQSEDVARSGELENPRTPLPPINLVWRLKRILKPVAWPFDIRHYWRPYLVQGGSALDIGAADGRFCFLLETFGYKAYGLEASETLVAWARLHNLDVQTGHFPDGLPPKLEQKRYDLITCFESLYYFVHIDECLAKIKELLKPSGYLLVKTLNARSTYFDETGNDLAVRYGDNAQVMPTLDSLRCWFERSGFEIVHITGMMWSKPVTPRTKSITSLVKFLSKWVANKFSSISLFGTPLFNLSRSDVLLVLARRLPKSNAVPPKYQKI